jgi:hypothetical protein
MMLVLLTDSWMELRAVRGEYEADAEDPRGSRGAKA